VLVVATLAIQPPPTALAQPEAILEGRAVLPADTFAEGLPSGAKLEDETKGGRTPPFESQPVGGFSAVLDEADDGYLAMADNGFGKKDNSADFLLRATVSTRTSRPPTGEAGRSRSENSYSCATRIDGYRSRSRTRRPTTAT